MTLLDMSTGNRVHSMRARMKTMTIIALLALAGCSARLSEPAPVKPISPWVQDMIEHSHRGTP